MTYFNTTHQTGEELLGEYRKAHNQDDAVCLLFYDFPDERLSASQVHQRLIIRRSIKESTPLTSIRRSMTSLADRNFLVKTDEQRKGPYGRPEYKYCLKYQVPSTGQGEMF